ncbi:sensor histidine kinase [Weissella viridescens]|uniref:histidine kinase n=2 Tax=Weissella viridescens TaxID=1629 RepID=A0A3P2RH98_WEIVI|nr:sensor histidine kinase [Weissella viridescens]
MTILMVCGFTLVFAFISLFSVSQFRELMYDSPKSRVEQTFNPNSDPRKRLEPAPVMDYTSTVEQVLKMKSGSKATEREFNGRWYFFERQGDKLAYLDITKEHEILENVSRRLLWIFGMAEIALLILSMMLTRSNMRPIMRSWKQQRRFVADAAHEFKTPMTVIQNDLERMLEHPQDTVMDQVENVAGALTEVRHLNNLIGDMLTLAQSDADVPMFKFDDFDLAETVNEVGDIFKFSAEERDQKLEIDVPETLPMYGDEQRIRQLLIILIDNAQKYAGPDSVVTVKAEQKNNSIKLSVSDTGSGVTDEQKKHLFDRFYRVDKARSRTSGGHGLGLSIAKWVVQGHHGTIQVVDTVPHGTTFNIVLPKTAKTRNGKEK